MQNDAKSFGDVAIGLSRSPLGIIALFIVLVYGFASLVTTLGDSLNPSEKTPLVYFLVLFPVLVLFVFASLCPSKLRTVPVHAKPRSSYARRTFLVIWRM